ncbi:unnamed protein product [Didymodactylos carnosus]|uniref:Uncharacterized protein n=1 Tax=Didymodactylos carnosus TaxID=1234261 RepID=A0A813Z5I3_9BILA|nr:unnamed protein product [Didymodactylos carnosus]CAF1606728.1 unnamed protein product [Didymodactylos carnosus]CAF3677574.1 unnamed protein product [Didymodactylos carnosus]CAF4418102.1 unnamed protein product [Didymodactylos carnosus]
MQQERDDENKRIDDETVKKCPKCLQNYIPSKTNYGNCHYHDGFIFDIDQNTPLSNDQAQAIAQKAKLLAISAGSGEHPKPPKLMWACCLGLYGTDPPCQVGICGLPEELKGRPIEMGQDQVALVQQHFMNNHAATQKIRKFMETYKTPPTTTRITNTTRTPISMSVPFYASQK